MKNKIITISLIFGTILLLIELYQIKKISESPKQDVLLIDKKSPDKYYWEVTYIHTEKLDITTQPIEIDFKNTIKERIPFFLWNELEKGNIYFVRKIDTNDQYIFGELSIKRVINLILISWKGRTFLITLIIFTLNLKTYNHKKS